PGPIIGGTSTGSETNGDHQEQEGDRGDGSKFTDKAIWDAYRLPALQERPQAKGAGISQNRRQSICHQWNRNSISATPNRSVEKSIAGARIRTLLCRGPELVRVETGAREAHWVQPTRPAADDANNRVRDLFPTRRTLLPRISIFQVYY